MGDLRFLLLEETNGEEANKDLKGKRQYFSWPPLNDKIGVLKKGADHMSSVPPSTLYASTWIKVGT